MIATVFTVLACITGGILVSGITLGMVCALATGWKEDGAPGLVEIVMLLVWLTFAFGLTAAALSPTT